MLTYQISIKLSKYYQLSAINHNQRHVLP